MCVTRPERDSNTTSARLWFNPHKAGSRRLQPACLLVLSEMIIAAAYICVSRKPSLRLRSNMTKSPDAGGTFSSCYVMRCADSSIPLQVMPML